MALIIHCIRHAQGYHNLGAEFSTLQDPPLTPFGEEQCETLRTTLFTDQSNISLVTASPLGRTIHAASLIFKPALGSNGKCPPRILALPDTQETSDDPCDTGSDPLTLRCTAEENHWPVDLSLVKYGWNSKALNGRYSPSHEAIKIRARDSRLLFRRIVRELVENGDENVEIVLLTHGGFLHYFTDDWEDSDTGYGTGWKNCEARSYSFEMGLETDEDDEARLVETTQSRLRRGKSHPMPLREKQPELFEIGMKRWGELGLQRPDRVGLESD